MAPPSGLPQRPEKAAAPAPYSPSSQVVFPAGFEAKDLGVFKAERRLRRMATIQDDDERMLMRIGYKQVSHLLPSSGLGGPSVDRALPAGPGNAP